MPEVSLSGNLITNPLAFEKLVQASKKSVICDDQGNFHVEYPLIAIIRKIVSVIFRDLFGCEARKYVGWAKGTVYAFDQCEQDKKHSMELLKTAKTVKKILKQNKSSKVNVALTELKIRTTALKYRLGIKNAQQIPEDKKVELYKKLESQAEAWKKTQIVYQTHELSPEEKRQLKTLLKYPKFAALVYEDETLRTKFFYWALLAKNNVGAFVQFPRTVEKLTDLGLSEKIGRYGGKDLQIKKEVDSTGNLIKDLTLPFEGKHESILNEKHCVTLSNDYKLSIQEVFKIFKDRISIVGNLEYFGEGKGITNWNANEWGYFNPAKNDYDRIDMNDPDWIFKMPFSEIIDEDEAKERFEDKDANKLEFAPDEWVFTVIGKNEYKEANLTGAHTMLCIAVPLENGKRGLCYMSKFVWEFPDKEKEKWKYVRTGFDTVRAAIQSPDENFYQISRDEEGVSWRATQEEARVILNRISKDKKLVEKGALNFQFLIYNCTDWVFKKLRRRKESGMGLVTPEERDEVAGMCMWDAKPEGLASYLVKMPNKVRKGIINLALMITQPKGQLKKRKNGDERELRLTLEHGPWRGGGDSHHPSAIIKNKRLKRAKKEKSLYI